MGKQCLVDNEKIGALTGFVKTGDNQYICRSHWKKMGFNTLNDPSKYGPMLTSDTVKQIINSGEKGPDYLKNSSGATDRLAQIKQQFADAGVSDLFGTKKEVKALPDIIHDGEIIKYATSGLVNGNTILMVCTNQRVLFIDKGLVYGIKSTEIPLAMVNAISYSKGLLLGTISITNGATVTKVENVNKETAPKMVETVNIARNEYLKPKQTDSATDKAPDVTDELRKYKSLLDDGIITQEEFDAKKKQLLDL